MTRKKKHLKLIEKQWISRHDLETKECFGELHLSKGDIKETIEELDSFREYERDKKTESEVLTSDEI